MSSLSQLTDATYESDIASGVTLVDFWAPWCGPCKAMLPKLEEFAMKEPRVKVMKCNVDENSDTPLKFRIMSIPTMVLFKDGKPVATKVGTCSVEDLIALTTPHLA